LPVRLPAGYVYLSAPAVTVRIHPRHGWDGEVCGAHLHRFHTGDGFRSDAGPHVCRRGVASRIMPGLYRGAVWCGCAVRGVPVGGVGVGWHVLAGAEHHPERGGWVAGVRSALGAARGAVLPTDSLSRRPPPQGRCRAGHLHPPAAPHQPHIGRPRQQADCAMTLGGKARYIPIAPWQLHARQHQHALTDPVTRVVTKPSAPTRDNVIT
jgi:hypothetical protein